MNGGDLVDRDVIWLYTVEGVLMFQSNKLYLKIFGCVAFVNWIAGIETFSEVNTS